MVLTLISVSFTAYAFSRFRFKGRQNGLMLFLLLQMIPQFSALIAIFVLSQLLGLINSHLALVLIYVGGMIPMNTWLMKGISTRSPKIWMSPPAWTAPAASASLSRSSCRCRSRFSRWWRCSHSPVRWGFHPLQHHPAYPG
jgi:hypothetical protein